jgi:pyroglutamyl-peptidase
MTKVLLTAFEPFGGQSLNPSQEVVRVLQGVTFEGLSLEICVLPVERFRAIDRTLEAMKRFTPDVVVMLGEAGGRTGITLETIAVNLDDFRIPDAAGQQPRGEPIVGSGPLELHATLPVQRLVERLTKEGFPVTRSVDAGRYLCNRLFYVVLYTVAQMGLHTQAGFIHLPYLPKQTLSLEPPKPSLPLETQVAALTLLLNSFSFSDVN